jgi:hypothetical protein
VNSWDTKTRKYIDSISYLAKSAYLDVLAVELRLATLCINYLSLPSFRAPYSERAVMPGEYGFMEYAVLYWTRHLKAGLTSSPSGQDELQEDLGESLEILVEQHWKDPTGNISVPDRFKEILRIFRGRERYLQIQIAVVSTDKELNRFGDLRPDKSAPDFTGTVSAVRRCLEEIVQKNRTKGLLML